MNQKLENKISKAKQKIERIKSCFAIPYFLLNFQTCVLLGVKATISVRKHPYNQPHSILSEEEIKHILLCSYFKFCRVELTFDELCSEYSKSLMWLA